MTRGPVDPNAVTALNRLKYEIANELGVTKNLSGNNGEEPLVDNIFFAGKVGGHMTKRMIEVAERQLADGIKE